MARQAPFTEYEAVLLLDAFLQAESGDVSRKDAIKNCSDALRSMAVSNGMEIDGTYRNINGITFQMERMESAYRGMTVRISATALFTETVEKYKTDCEEYGRILKEAKLMLEDRNNNEVQFMTWLSHKVSSAQLSELYMAFQEIEQYAKKKGIIDSSLYEEIDVNLFKKVSESIRWDAIFKFMHNKGQMRNIILALNYLIQYAQEYLEISKTLTGFAQECIEETEKDEKSVDDTIKNVGNVRTVNFNAMPNIGFAKAVAFTYFGERRKEESWQTLYVNLCKRLLDDYPDCFEQMLSDSMKGRTRIWLVDKTHINMFESPKLIGGDFYIETKRSASYIIKSIRWILEQCNVDFENVVIEYIKQGDNDAHTAISDEKSDKKYMPEKKDLIDTESSVPMAWKQMMLDVESCVPMAKEPTMLDVNPYRIVLEKYFPKGYRLDSSIEMKKFRRYYGETSGTELQSENEEIEAAIRQSGVEHDGRVYAPRTMMDDDINNRVFEYVEKCFSEGKTVIYFEAIFREFSEEFLDHNIYDADMLKAYIVYMASGRYFIGRNYMSKEQDATCDPIEDVRMCLKECGLPMKTEDLCQTLSHIPETRIRTILGTGLEFVRNSKGEYFHADSFVLSEEELENISAIINAEIDLHEYISGNELYDAIKAKYPHIYERNMIFSVLGWRDALKYKLWEQYSFAGNIVSAKGKDLSMSNVFSNYAKERGEFTLQELLAFAENMGSTVYFDALYKNAARVSSEQFVGKDSVSFNVKDTDRILDRFCTGAYCAIPAIKDFGIFPDASYPWTTFLLEYYLAHCSERYCLMHIVYNQNAVVGAMVKRDRQYAGFDELAIDILAECGLELQKKDALDYLYDNGYIARRSYNNIESILINARAKRNKKEK